jgi:hypothetical protein
MRNLRWQQDPMCIGIEKNTQGRKNTEKIWQIKKFDISL